MTTIIEKIVQEVLKRKCLLKKDRVLRKPKNVKDFIQKYGDKDITSIIICKTPVEKYVKTALNVISLGKFNKNIQDLSYDNIFHLYIYVVIGNETFIMEKNEIITITKAKGGRPKENCIVVPMRETKTKVVKRTQHPRQRFTGQLTFGGRNSRYNIVKTTIQKKVKVKDFFQRAENLQGEYNFWVYDPMRANCQAFITHLLLGSGLIRHGDVRYVFINQKSYEMFKDIKYVNQFGKRLTDLANVMEGIAHGC